MRGVVLEEYEEPFDIRDVERPTPDPDGVVASPASYDDQSRMRPVASRTDMVRSADMSSFVGCW
jgi:hypothetical protein